MLLINETVAQNSGTAPVAIVLDLDAFLEREMPSGESDLWNLVEDLHVNVEEAFEASITDQMRELIT